MATVYEHCGSNRFYKSRFTRPTNRMWNKPDGGLWASPVDSPQTWENWCKEQHYANYTDTNRFRFVLRDESKVLHINKSSDLEDIPLNLSMYEISRMFTPDFEKIAAKGYDAVEIHVSNDPSLYWSMYGWDCDSIVVLNPDAIIETKENLHD